MQDSVADIRNIGLSGAKPAVLIIVFRQPGANIISTVDRVRAALPQLESSISPAIDVGVVMDRTTTVRASVHDIEVTLMRSRLFLSFLLYLRSCGPSGPRLSPAWRCLCPWLERSG